MSTIVSDTPCNMAKIDVESVTNILTAISDSSCSSRAEHIERILYETAWAIVGPFYDATPEGAPEPGGAVLTCLQDAAYTLNGLLSKLSAL